MLNIESSQKSHSLPSPPLFRHLGQVQNTPGWAECQIFGHRECQAEVLTVVFQKSVEKTTALGAQPNLDYASR